MTSMKRVLVVWLVCLAAVGGPVCAMAAPGSLDTTFGSGGIVTSPNYLRAVAIDADGRIVVAGASAGRFVVVMRYLPTGSLDTTFGSGGIVTGINGAGNAVTIDADGRIVVAGYSVGINGYEDLAVVRVLASGSLDTTFGSAGMVMTSISGVSDYGNAVAIDGSGRIVVAGSFQPNTTGPYDLAVVRYLPSGSLDTTFGSGGIVTVINGAGNAVTIDADGRIVVAGASGGFVAVVRYLPTGSLDTTFGSGGIVTTSIGPSSDRGYAVAIDGSGRIVVAGAAGYPGYRGSVATQIAVVRYLASGSLDTTFGSGGMMTTTTPPIAYDEGPRTLGYAMAIDASGRIVVAGESSYNLAVVRVLASGSLDTTFGSGGMVMTSIGQSRGNGVAIDGSGRIVVAASLSGLGFPGAVVRYQGGSAGCQ